MIQWSEKILLEEKDSVFLVYHNNEKIQEKINYQGLEKIPKSKIVRNNKRIKNIKLSFRMKDSPFENYHYKEKIQKV